MTNLNVQRYVITFGPIIKGSEIESTMHAYDESTRAHYYENWKHKTGLTLDATIACRGYDGSNNQILSLERYRTRRNLILHKNVPETNGKKVNYAYYVLVY